MKLTDAKELAFRLLEFNKEENVIQSKTKEKFQFELSCRLENYPISEILIEFENSILLQLIEVEFQKKSFPLKIELKNLYEGSSSQNLIYFDSEGYSIDDKSQIKIPLKMETKILLIKFHHRQDSENGIHFPISFSNFKFFQVFTGIGFLLTTF